MKLLVLGGTVFVGRALVEAALDAGHEVSVFHRGQRGAGLFPRANVILGDRDGGLDALGTETWDAVADTCGYLPRIVRQSALGLQGRVGRYLFVSTISVYAEPVAEQADESSPLATLSDPSVEEITGETYGGLKVLCEEAVRELHPNHIIVRPGLVAGPNDPTNRFTYWVDRFHRGGRVVVPNALDQPLQLIDARDLGSFMLRALESGHQGTFNATGPPTTFGEMIEVCRRIGSPSEAVLVDETQLKANGIEAWSELPLYMGEGPFGMMTVRSDRALEAGLQLRPFEQTARDTLEWSLANPPANPPRHGLAAGKEAQLLAALNPS